MSLRLSLVLIIIACWVGVGATYLVKNPPEAFKDPEPPFFYNLSSDDLRAITITAMDQGVTWVYNDEERRWFFSEPKDVPASVNRWGGITTLLGGPKTQRVLNQKIDDATKYGLDVPDLSISVLLRDGSTVSLDIGKSTPNKGAHYARVVGYPQLVTIDSSWGDVLSRLVNEPPYPDWWYTMDPTKATELLLFNNNEIIRGYGKSDDDNKWYLCTLPVVGDPCRGTQLADESAVLAALQTISDRHITGVAKIGVTEQAGYAQYGATVDAPYLTVRIENEKKTNVTEVTRTTLTIGGLTPDGKERYAVANETQDIIRAEVGWASEILQFFKAEPYLAKN